jgi:rhodanese-related sulfurtransferase
MTELQNVDVVGALELMNDGALLLDVREDSEWEAGHAPTALHIALSELPDRLDTLAKDRSVVCVCRVGGRSARAARFLMEQGFSTVNLEGGMLAWSSGGGALVADGGEPTVI